MYKMVSGSCIINEICIINDFGLNSTLFGMLAFFSESSCIPGSILGMNLWYDEGQTTKQDGVWVMHNK